MLDDIREKLEEWEEPAPEGLWERIETGERNTRKPLPVIRKSAVIIGAAAAAVALFLLTLPQLRRSEERTGTIAVAPAPSGTTVLPPGTVPTSDVEYPAEETNDTELNSRGPLVPQKTAVDTTAAGQDRVQDRTAAIENICMQGDVSAVTGAGKKRLSRTGALERRRPQEKKRSSDVKGRTLSADSEGDRNSARGLLSIGISASNSTGAESRRQGYTSITGDKSTSMMYQNAGHMWIDPETNMKFANSSRETVTENRHRLPLTTGVTLRYRLPFGLGIETGISYTWLSSTFQSGSQESHYITDQAIHYIGIPLNVNYTAWSSRYLDIYASAGILMEKCIGAASSTEYILYGNILDSGHPENPDARPLQWSVNATAGIQFNITPSIGLYAEPGIAWWFDDGSDLQTIYKARPLNFYLRFGLRFSFDM